MKKKILGLGTIVATVAPIAAVVSCSIKIIEDKDKVNLELIHNYDFTTESGWQAFDQATSLKIDIEPSFPASYKTDWMFSKNDFRTKLLSSVKTNNSLKFHELISTTLSDNSKIANDVYGAIYSFGTKSDVLNSEGGIVNLSKISEMNHANQFDYLSNITAHTLSEGGHINMDLFVKDGKIYNIPANNVSNNPTLTSIEQITYNFIRPALIMNKSGIPEIVDGIKMSYNNSLYSLNIHTNEKTIPAIEKKNIPAFDYRIDPITKNERYVVNTSTLDSSTIASMQNGETRVISEYYNPQKETLDLTNYKAFEVEASKVNGITTVEDLFYNKNIIQAPYEGKVTKEVSGVSNYKIPFGKSLIVQKNPTDTFTIGQNVDVSYDWKNDPIATKIKNSKWAVTTIDYGGAHWNFNATNHLDNYDSSFMSNVWTDLNRNDLIFNGSHILKNGNPIGQFAVSTEPSALVPRTYFVIDSVNKKFGVIHFVKNNNSSKMLTNEVFLHYVKSLGFTDAIMFDGGGSSHGFTRNNHSLIPFPESVDIDKYRIMSLALGIGGSDE